MHSAIPREETDEFTTQYIIISERKQSQNSTDKCIIGFQRRVNHAGYIRQILWNTIYKKTHLIFQPSSTVCAEGQLKLLNMYTQREKYF